jgi:hypothetical protein
VLGAALFVAYGLMPRARRGGEAGAIVVTRGQIANLVDGFTRAWHRPPTTDELEGLVQDRVREEVYCREAVAMGLDKDDTIIRRRLRQKIEFISNDIATLAEPTDADLNAYLQAHAETFRVEQRLTFKHVYLDPGKRGDHLANDAARLLAQLSGAGAGDAGGSEMGDSFLLELQFADAPAGDIAKQFGEQFASALGRLPPGQWIGPVASGYGVHLVRVSRRSEGRLPALAEVREAVRREWDNARRQEANEAFYQGLLKRHPVVIEPPEPSALPLTLAERQAK